MRVPGVMDAFSLARCVRVPEERLCTNAAVPGYAVADGRRGTSVRTIGNGKAFGRRCCTFASDVCTDPTPDLYLLNASMVRLSPALRVTVSVSSRRIAIVLSRVITESFSHFCIIYVRFGGASDPLAHNSAPLITLPEAGVSLVGGTHMMIEPYFASGDNVDNERMIEVVSRDAPEQMKKRSSPANTIAKAKIKNVNAEAYVRSFTADRGGLNAFCSATHAKLTICYICYSGRNISSGR
ncbi:hypothetical protein MRX96_019376 [Rhipicephalus microplus]